jgi:hypothetical protein
MKLLSVIVFFLLASVCILSAQSFVEKYQYNARSDFGKPAKLYWLPNPDGGAITLSQNLQELLRYDNEYKVVWRIKSINKGEAIGNDYTFLSHSSILTAKNIVFFYGEQPGKTSLNMVSLDFAGNDSNPKDIGGFPAKTFHLFAGLILQDEKHVIYWLTEKWLVTRILRKLPVTNPT